MVFKSLQLSQLLTFSVALSVIVAVNQIVMNLYLFSTAGWHLVIGYRAAELLFVVPAVLLTGYLLDRKGARWALGLSIGLRAVQTTWLIWAGADLASWLVVLAGLSGAATASQFLTLGLFIRQQLSEQLQSDFYSTQTIIGQVLAVLFPVLSGLIIVQVGYLPLFGLSLVASIVAAILLVKLPGKLHQTQFAPLKVLTRPAANLRKIWVTQWLWGIEIIMIGLLLPLVIVTFFGGELGWGIISTGIAAATIGLTTFIHRRWGLQSVQIYGLIGFGLSALVLAFVAGSSRWWLVLFVLGASLWQASQNFGLRPHLNLALSQLKQSDQLETEYALSLELPFLLGKLISLGVLYVASEALTNTLVLGLLLSVLSLIPLYEAFVYLRPDRRRRIYLASAA